MIMKTETKSRTCWYPAACRRLAALAALLSAAGYCALMPEAVYRTPYYLCVAAAISLLAVLLLPENHCGPVQKCFPLMLKVCYCIVSTNLLFPRGSTLAMSSLPAFILWTVRGVAACAVLASAYCFSVEGSTEFGYRCWRIFTKMIFAGTTADCLLLVFLIAAMDPNILAGTSISEFFGRLSGELFFSTASLLCLRPDFVTINVHKFRRLARQYLAAAVLPAVFFVTCTQVFHLGLSLSHTIPMGSIMSCEITLIIQVFQPLPCRRTCRSLLREYCEGQWYYTLADIAAVSRLLKRLADIRSEIAACRASEESCAYLGCLYLEQSEIESILLYTYELDTEMRESRPTRRRR